MLGRATRLCPELYGPGDDKERFRIFDAVNIYEDLQEVSDMHPVVTRPNVTFDQLVQELIDVDDDEFRAGVKDQLLAKLRRRKLKGDQADQLVALTGLDRKQLIDHVHNTSPKNLAEWFASQTAVTSILDDVRREGTKFIVSDHEDELRRVDRGYGNATKPEYYLESFRNYITQNLDELPALIVVTQRPRDLTRSQLRELRLQLDQAGFTEANLRTAVRETTNQDIAWATSDTSPLGNPWSPTRIGSRPQ
jgi:type I restriction enzyme R subunit